MTDQVTTPAAHADFTPSATALRTVGLTPEDIRTDEQIIALVKTASDDIALRDAQISVAIYVLVSRGHGYDHILKTTGIPERTAIRRKIEGMAILRTGNTSTVVEAIRFSSLSDKVVDATTKGAGSKPQKIAALVEASFGQATQRAFKPEKGEEIDTPVLAAVLKAAHAQVKDNEEPVTVKNLFDAVPHFAEKMGLKPKEQKRTPQDGDAAPKGLEFHAKAALADLKKIVAANDDTPYVPTPQDMKALLDLCTYIDVTLDLTPEVAAAVEALASK